ncbi:hypothetical protein ACVBEG_27840 [Pseudomonas sp. GG8]
MINPEHTLLVVEQSSVASNGLLKDLADAMIRRDQTVNWTYRHGTNCSMKPTAMKSLVVYFTSLKEHAGNRQPPRHE